MRPVPSTRRPPGGRRTPGVVGVVLCLGLLTACNGASREVVSDERAAPAAPNGSERHGSRASRPAAGAWHDHGRPAERGSQDVADERDAVEVIRVWDRERSSAYAAGEVAALRRLYLPGSAAGTADVQMLRRYLYRGVRVEGMRMQLLAVQVLADGPRRVRLRVTDRVVGAVAVGAESRTRLPADNASTRVLELRRSGGDVRWRVAWVRDVSR